MSSSAAGPITPATTKLGWIGTGVMGSSMCSHLLKAGYTVTVFTRTKSKAQTLLSMGAHWADSPKSLASQSDVVFSIVGFPSDVRHVLLDPYSGALSGLRPGGALVDMTTSARLLLGRRPPAWVTIASTMVGLCEGLIYAHKAGLDLKNYLTAISTGAAGSKSLDLECQSMGLSLPGLGLAQQQQQQLYVSLQAHSEGDLGTQALILALERLNNCYAICNSSSE
ncbi:hypothetical protein SASPL_109822 [Salvia splendens]|uniref:3-hydroxyisobutyrate dehydrogenase n=1 Tax=Salvia splendens TaxID=180675 RepID=A0A8X8YHV8_SALSN|nr:hypothetical protein SASPL_109822 [Salvia splendens]